MKKLIKIILSVLLILILFPVTLSADMGPKPSIHITFKDIDEEFYVTLLTKEDGFGPWSAYEGKKEDIKIETNEDKAFYKFLEYCESDDYYFLQNVQRCSETNEYTWTYFPSEDFKLAIYLVESDKLIVSDVYSKYAFNSYYEYDFKTNTLKENYDFTASTISLIIRVIITVLIEVGIALLFKFKDHLKLIIIVNIITQLLLNLFVNYCAYSGGLLTAIILVFVGEAFVFVIEAIIFKIVIKKWAITYTIIANVASFAVGAFIGLMLPGLV